jgi:hypothetical protein
MLKPPSSTVLTSVNFNTAKKASNRSVVQKAQNVFDSAFCYSSNCSKGLCSSHCLIRQVWREIEKLKITEIIWCSAKLQVLLTELLKRLPAEIVADALPSAVRDRIIEPIADGIDRLWSPEKALHLKYELDLSDVDYDKLNHILRDDRVKDGSDFVWKRRKVGDDNVNIPAPSLPSRQRVHAVRDSISSLYQVRQHMDGKLATCDPEISLVAHLSSKRKRGVWNPSEKVEIQLKGDASRIAGHKQVTALALTTPRLSLNSPDEQITVALFEGDDHWKSVEKHGDSVRKFVNDIIQNAGFAVF